MHQGVGKRRAGLAEDIGRDGLGSGVEGRILWVVAPQGDAEGEGEGEQNKATKLRQPVMKLAA